MIAITGNTSGIGKAISDELEDVIGYNRSENYNIDNYKDRQNIIDNLIINKTQIFINNAYGDTFSQTNMLYDLCERLHETNINHIININSINYNNMTPRGIPQSKYAVSKNAMLMCSEHMRYLYDVYITDVMLGLSDTTYNKNKKEAKLSMKDVGSQISDIIKADFKINSITIMK